MQSQFCGHYTHNLSNPRQVLSENMSSSKDNQDTVNTGVNTGVDTGISDFSIGTILFYMPHLILKKKPGHIVDVTSGVPFPNTLSPQSLITAAQKVFDDLPPDAAGIEQ